MKREDRRQECSAGSLNSFHEEAARSQAPSCCHANAVCEKPAPPHFHPHSSWAAFATRCTLGSEPSGRCYLRDELEGSRSYIAVARTGRFVVSCSDAGSISTSDFVRPFLTCRCHAHEDAVVVIFFFQAS